MFEQMNMRRMEQVQTQQMRQELRQTMRMEQANLLEMGEEDFNRLIVDTEHDPLFKKLYRQEKLIRYQRLPRTDVSASFYQLEAELVADRASPDVESVLLNQEPVIGRIRELGLEKFKRYFLFPESGMSLEDIAGECRLSLAEVKRINRLIDDISIMGEFHQPSAVSSGHIRYTKVAAVEKDEKGFIIGYHSPALARGRYLIEYERFEEMKASGSLTPAEARQARQLFRRLELINSRKNTLTQILQAVIDKQAAYLESDSVRSLLPFSQKELAEKIGLAPSSVSRAIRGRSIDTPWGAEVPLKDFFPRPRRFRLEILRRLLENDNGLASDEAIRTKLREELGVAISRRTVANLRQELKLPGAKEKRPSARERS